MRDERGRVVMIDGEIVAPERATVSVYDRGFLYGDSVFEAMRTYEGVPFALADHVERLFRSAERVFIDIPVSREAIASEVLEAAAAALPVSNVVRVHCTRGTGPLALDPAEAHDPTRVILVEPAHLPSTADYREGIRALLVRTERVTDNTAAAGAKVANYLVSLLALREARATGAKEAIIVDGHGRVLEGTTSNVFAVTAGTVMTPPESEGILSGITRKYVLEAAGKLGIQVRITTMSTGDLLTADEVFVSSTIRELLPVVEVDGQPIGDGRPGAITRLVHEAFRKAGGLTGALPWEQPGP
jgi:branched-chain amino acid aminotransferase